MAAAIQSAPGCFEINRGPAVYRARRVLFAGKAYRLTCDKPQTGEFSAYLAERKSIDVFTGQDEWLDVGTIIGELDAHSAPSAILDAVDLE